MDLNSRPRLSDFQPRVGESFHAEVEGGEEVGTWRLDSCEPLPRPPIEELAEADCFTLSFTCERSVEQGFFRVTLPDGFGARLFAVPVAPDRMWVTIN
jgi:hypothetical protein